MIRKFQFEVRKFLTLLLKEGLDPRRAAAAVFLGIFIGITPLYGFHALAAVGVALLLRLNKPLTVACTFISNPLLQPLIVFSSVELGCLLRNGSFQRLSLSELAAASSHLSKEQLFIWIIGSVALGILAGGVGAAVTAVVVHLHRRTSANSVLPPLHNNRELYVYLVDLSARLRTRGDDGSADLVAAASRIANTIPATEFLGESRIALRRVSGAQTVLTERESEELMAVLRQLDQAFTRG